jgi:hypothetical protein
MKVISFDVGIKNLAYCLFEIDADSSLPTNSFISDNKNDHPCKIADWKVLSLMEEEAPIVHCNCSAVKTKSKNTIAPNRLCGRVAKYNKGEQFFCDKHAKAQTVFRLPEKKKVNKMGLEELIRYAMSLGLLQLPKKKADILCIVESYLKEHSLDPIVIKKGAKAGDTDLIIIGKNMKRIFQTLLKDISIDHVLIENQISPLANRMKTVQGMLAQYFIMSYENVNIEFISSANKLKMFSKEKTETSSEEKTQGQIYKTHKKDGVFYCEQVLASGKWPTDLWTTCEKKKKDDLADCFLQGIWWLQKEDLISIK